MVINISKCSGSSSSFFKTSRHVLTLSEALFHLTRYSSTFARSLMFKKASFSKQRMVLKLARNCCEYSTTLDSESTIWSPLIMEVLSSYIPVPPSNAINNRHAPSPNMISFLIFITILVITIFQQTLPFRGGAKIDNYSSIVCYSCVIVPKQIPACIVLNIKCFTVSGIF